MTDTASRIAYFKRHKMEAELADAPPPPLPPGFRLLPWDEGLLDDHAQALYESFRAEVDAIVVPSLGDPIGCRTLMLAIVRKRNFVADATWLLVGPEGPCGSVQGLCERGVGAIQNLGVVPLRRGLGLGSCLLGQALDGFRRVGLGRAMLEVTACNDGALRLYRRFGFRRARTIYKAVPDLPIADCGL
jgi:GNAT superfamily N-acetyltransferase